MHSQNPDSLELLRYSINDLIDRMKLQQQHNLIQDHRLSEHDSQLAELKQKYEENMIMLQGLQFKVQDQQAQIEECQESSTFAVVKVHQFEYLIPRNQELEEIAAFYRQIE
ncbi:MAG: hypothetical protein KME30_21785 [Iphinoe sp. HA4291-MV1]|jgi:hypothetical protein|nr:hypothetical protein [Iphinoe sp. HA4291-MV1]